MTQVTMARKGRRRRQKFQQSVPLVLGTRRVEQAPTRPSIWLFGGVGLTALLGLGLWFALSPRFYVGSAQVAGTSRIAQKAVFQASGLAGLHILWVDEQAAEARIVEQLPSVEAAKVACQLPADCVITVVERAPVLTWEVGGSLFWVDAAGMASPAGHPLEGRWLVSGPLPADDDGLVDQEVLIGLAELTRLGVRPGRIAYRSGRGLVLDDPAGWRVVLGQGSGMERRLQVYATVRAYVLARGVHPQFVDVRFPEAPYYSETNEW